MRTFAVTLLMFNIASSSLVSAQADERRSGAVRASHRALKDDQGEFFALGVTVMWALWAYRHDRAWLERNLDYLSRNGFDYIRALGVISREPARPGDYWYRLDMNSSWADYDEMIAGLTDLAYDRYGLRIEWTIFGGAGDFNEGQKQQLIDRFLRMSRGREHKIIHFETANEYEGTGWRGDDSIRNWTRYLNDRTNVLVAASAAYQETNDLCGEFQALYRGGIADIGTWHFDRETRLGDGMWRPIRQPWEYPYCTGLPLIGSNNEPLGPGSSVASDTDPMRQVSGAIVSYISGLPLHVYHSEAGVRADNGDYTAYHTAVTEGFRAMKRYVPKDITNWTRENHHWAGHPFTFEGEIGYPTERGSGAVRAYGATKGNEFFVLPMGIRDFLRARPKRDSKFCAVNPVTGEIVGRYDLKAGQAFELRGLSAFVLRGKTNSGDDGCEDYSKGGSFHAGLRPGQSMKVGQTMKSRNGRYDLVYQHDNNLVLYTEGRPVWASDTSGVPNPSSVEMQGDGNLVIYDKLGQPVWASGTAESSGAEVVLEDGGKLAIRAQDGSDIKVLYAPPVTLKAGQGLNTHEVISSRPGCDLVLQGDGNLVLYDQGVAYWATYSFTDRRQRLEMQGDGNLVTYDDTGTPLWASDTAGQDGAYLNLYTNCRLTLHSQDGGVLREFFAGH